MQKLFPVFIELCNLFLKNLVNNNNKFNQDGQHLDKILSDIQSEISNTKSFVSVFLLKTARQNLSLQFKIGQEKHANASTKI